MARWASIVLCLIGCAIVQPALACSCAFEHQPIAAYRETPVVFVGTVTSVRADKVHSPWFDEDVTTGMAAYLAVNEPLKGITEAEATVLTGGDHGGCGFGFEKGQTYAVFAWPFEADANRGKVAETVHGGPAPKHKPLRGAVLETSICSLTAPVGYRSAHLSMIRSFRENTHQPLIHGRVAQYGYELSGWPLEVYLGPMRGIEIVAEGRGRRLTTRTDESGSFVFQGLDVGEYLLRLKLPESHRTNSAGGDAMAATLNDREEVAEVYFRAQLVNRLGGTLITAAGQSPQEQVELSLIRLNTANKPIQEIESLGTYAKDGRFVFEAVPPGQYIMGVSVIKVPAKNTPYPKTYYPRGDRVEEAQRFDIETPTAISDLQFVLPTELETVQVRGIAVDAGGKAVPGAIISLSDSQELDDTVFGYTDVKTDATGRFTITGFKGRRYELHAFKRAELVERKLSVSRPVEITFGTDARPIRLVMDQLRDP